MIVRGDGDFFWITMIFRSAPMTLNMAVWELGRCSNKFFNVRPHTAFPGTVVLNQG